MLLVKIINNAKQGQCQQQYYHKDTQAHNFTQNTILWPVSTGREEGAHHHPPSWRTRLRTHTLISRPSLPYFNFSLYSLQFPNTHYITHYLLPRSPTHTCEITSFSPPGYTISSRRQVANVNFSSHSLAW